jgi:hypothetical protein
LNHTPMGRPKGSGPHRKRTRPRAVVVANKGRSRSLCSGQSILCPLKNIEMIMGFVVAYSHITFKSWPVNFHYWLIVRYTSSYDSQQPSERPLDNDRRSTSPFISAMLGMPIIPLRTLFLPFLRHNRTEMHRPWRAVCSVAPSRGLYVVVGRLISPPLPLNAAHGSAT